MPSTQFKLLPQPRPVPPDTVQHDPVPCGERLRFIRGFGIALLIELLVAAVIVVLIIVL